MKKKLNRVLVVSTGFDGIAGGIQRYSQSLFRTLNGIAGKEVHGFQVQTGSFFLKLLATIHLVLKTILLRPQLVVCTHIHLAILFIILRPLLRFRLVASCHGIEVWNPNRFLVRHSIKHADELWVVSKFTASKLRSPKTKSIQYLPNTFNDQQFSISTNQDDLKKSFGIYPDAFVFLTVNRFEREEDFHSYESILPAFELIKKTIPDAVWICVGDGNDHTRFRRKVEDSQFSDSIFLPGKVSDLDLQNYYQAADFFVMPSKLEGFGIVFLEALASGLYCLSGDKDGARQVISSEEFGIALDPDNSQTMALEICNIINNKPELFNIESRQRRRELVIKKFGPRRFEKRLRSILGKSFDL